mgnify:FL=1|jgi:hypothetical protein
MKMNVRLEVDGVGSITEFKGVTMEYLLKSLKRLESNVRGNEIEGTKVFGKHNNSKNTKTNPNMDFKGS